MKAAKVDRNQSEIVNALRKAGVSVSCTHAMGQGFPDLVCGYQSVNYLLEIKDGALPPSARKLTKQQEKFHASWQGQKCVVTSVAEAFEAVGIRAQEIRGARQ